MPQKHPTGGLEVRTVLLSRLRLDGGGMYGTVPKVIWERLDPPDASNRVPLVCRALLLRGEGRALLVDAGMGDKFTEKETEIYQVSQATESELPFSWESLTHVVLTHLHFDHAGGLTRWAAERNGGGADPQDDPVTVLKAPGARIHLQRANWERARTPGPRERASYLAENVEPLASGNLVLVDGDQEILPGVRVHRSDGHTEGLQWVTLSTGRDTIAFPSDLVPTANHLHLPFVMGYDMRVDSLLSEKERFLRQAVEESWIVVFAHDSRVPAARIGRGQKGRFVVREAMEEGIIEESGGLRQP